MRVETSRMKKPNDALPPSHTRARIALHTREGQDA